MTNNKTKNESHQRACFFIEALFRYTDELLKKFDSQWGIEKVAQEFRIRMTAGQTTTKHNEFRCKFYEEVIRIAEEKLADKAVCLV